jgi:hypothetical protein
MFQPRFKLSTSRICQRCYRYTTLLGSWRWVLFPESSYCLSYTVISEDTRNASRDTPTRRDVRYCGRTRDQIDTGVTSRRRFPNWAFLVTQPRLYARISNMTLIRLVHFWAILFPIATGCLWVEYNPPLPPFPHTTPTQISPSPIFFCSNGLVFSGWEHICAWGT